MSWSRQGGTSGGANRSTIYGNARWGSGCGYVSDSGPNIGTFHPTLNLDGFYDGLPYGFWPIYWNSGDERDSRHDYSFDPFRPGGAQSALLVGMDETRQDAYYFVIADNTTVTGLNSILALPYEQGDCLMWSGNPVYIFKPDKVAAGSSGTLRSVTGLNSKQNITIVPNNIHQYYRGSSVALGANVYDNVHTVHTTTWGMTISDTPIEDYWARVPYNISLMTGVNRTEEEHVKFLDCLNQTIAAAVPIFDPTFGPFPENRPFKVGLGVGVPMVLLVFGGIVFWKFRRQRRKRLRGRVDFIGRRGEQLAMSTRRQEEGDDLPVYTPAARDREVPPAYTKNLPGL